MNLAKIFIVNAVAVENDSESTFLYVFNLSGLVFSNNFGVSRTFGLVRLVCHAGHAYSNIGRIADV